jgi:hypothetical protein
MQWSQYRDRESGIQVKRIKAAQNSKVRQRAEIAGRVLTGRVLPGEDCPVSELKRLGWICSLAGQACPQ